MFWESLNSSTKLTKLSQAKPTFSVGYPATLEFMRMKGQIKDPKNPTHQTLKSLERSHMQIHYLKIVKIMESMLTKQNKLQKSNTTLEEGLQDLEKIRAVVLVRPCIGHNHLTHSFRLKKTPIRTACQEPYKIKHIFIDCTKLTISGKNFKKIKTSHP